MIQNISIVCDAVFGAGSENFGTVTGNVTFQNGSANSGTVNGNATFNGNAEHKAGATVNGDATFAATAVNNGTVTGTTTVLDPAYSAWLAANTGVNQYTGSGPHNGQWAYNSTEYASQADAEAAAYNAWLAANTGVNQYTGAGSKNGQWAFNSTEYANSMSASYASEEAQYPVWLAANIGVNRAPFNLLFPNSTFPDGKWAYNSTEYASQAEANYARWYAEEWGGFYNQDNYDQLVYWDPTTWPDLVTSKEIVFNNNAVLDGKYDKYVFSVNWNNVVGAIKGGQTGYFNVLGSGSISNLDIWYLNGVFYFSQEAYDAANA